MVAAGHGRIKALVAPSDTVCWGRFNGGNGTMRKTVPDDIEGRDLYQLAAELTLHRGGRLFYLESMKMPRGARICAELRY